MSDIMTVTKGLSELKLLDKRITRRINETDFVIMQIGNKRIDGYDTVDDFNQSTKSGYDSIKDLIERRNKIKSAIVASNAVTKVNINGKEYTVAEAIERKSSISYEESLLDKMKRKYSIILDHVEYTNNEVRDRLDNHLKTLFGNENKVDEVTVASISESFNKENQAKMIDPINIKDKIEEIEVEIEDFLSEVDYTLSISNATTTIEIK